MCCCFALSWRWWWYTDPSKSVGTCWCGIKDVTLDWEGQLQLSIVTEILCICPCPSPDMASRRTYDNYLSGCSQIESAIKSPFPLVRSGHAMPSRGVVRQYNISRRSKSFKTLWDFHWYFTQYMSWSIKGRVGKIFFIENFVNFYAFSIKYSVLKIRKKNIKMGPLHPWKICIF